MTYEQAHKLLEVKQRDMTRNRGLFNETAIELNGKAIEAVEKQIPKKPIIKTDRLYIKCHCPFCDRLVHIMHICDSEIKNTNYCEKCGQRLDWSE